MEVGPVEHLYPLTFEPELKEKVWGGRRLGQVLGKALPPDGPIGESWEVHGGSIVASGAQAGQTLDEVRQQWGEQLLGSRVSGEIFPLLFKYIDASEYLSVQVHPDDDYAQAHTGYPYGKTEAWYILHAEPGAQLVHGWNAPTTPEEVAEAVRQNRLEDLLEYVPVSNGDIVFVPAGTVHAIGSGVVLSEIQQNSDTTYRLYDWGRVGLDGQPRELHVEESLRTLYYGETDRHKIEPLEIRENRSRRKVLVACRYFILESIEGSGECDLPHSGSFELLSPLGASARLCWQGGEATLAPGQTALRPAGLRECSLQAEGDFKLLRMYVPDLRSDVVAPLRSVGYSDEAIAQVGGDSDHSDLRALLA